MRARCIAGMALAMVVWNRAASAEALVAIQQNDVACVDKSEYKELENDFSKIWVISFDNNPRFKSLWLSGSCIILEKGQQYIVSASIWNAFSGLYMIRQEGGAKAYWSGARFNVIKEPYP